MTKTETDATGGTRVIVDAYVSLLVTMMLFGSAFAASKVVVSVVPYQVAAALRFCGGTVVLGVALAVSGRLRSVDRRQSGQAAAIGLIGVLLYNIFYFWGLSLAPSLDGTVIVPVLSPIITAMALIATGSEWTTWQRIVGLAVGLSGAAVFFVGMATGPGQASRLTGDLLLAGSACCWAPYSILSGHLLADLDPLHVTAWATASGALGLALVAAPEWGAVPWETVPASVWFTVGFLAVGPTAIAYLLYCRGLRVVGPSNATAVMFSVPIFGGLCSAFWLGESLSRTQILGAFIMVAGALTAVLCPQSTQARQLRVGVALTDSKVRGDP